MEPLPNLQFQCRNCVVNSGLLLTMKAANLLTRKLGVHLDYVIASISRRVCDKCYSLFVSLFSLVLRISWNMLRLISFECFVCEAGTNQVKHNHHPLVRKVAVRFLDVGIILDSWLICSLTVLGLSILLERVKFLWVTPPPPLSFSTFLKLRFFSDSVFWLWDEERSKTTIKVSLCWRVSDLHLMLPVQC